VVPLPTNHR